MEKATSPEPEMITIDMHIDVPWQLTKNGFKNIHMDLKDRDFDMGRARAGGLNAAFFALYTSDHMWETLGPDVCWRITQDQFFSIYQQCGIVETAREAINFAKEGGFPVFLGMEGARVIGHRPERLTALVNWGVRYLCLTHNESNDLADSATDLDKHDGLSDLGAEILKEANRLGMITDVSHLSVDAAYEAIELSTGPVIASHSACLALHAHPRNLPTSVMKEIVGTGGVIHIPFVRKFLGDKYSVADHIDHVGQTFGVHCVGIGSDLDGAILVPEVRGVQDWSFWMEALLKKGYSESDIARIAGGNTLEILKRD